MKNHLEKVNLGELKASCESGDKLTYKALCEKIGLNCLGGNSKINQLEALATICDYEYVGEPRRYVMKEYYESFAPSMCNGKSKYAPYIEAVMCSLLKIDDTMYMTNSDILLACKMINDNFALAKNKKNRKSICQANDYKIVDFNCFVDNTYYKILLPIVRSALISLERRKVVSIAPAYKYKAKTNGDTYNTYCVPASDEVGRKLLQIEHDAKSALGLGDRKILSVKETEDYQVLCNSLVRERLGFVSFYRCKEIVTHKEIVTGELPKICEELNKVVGERVITSTQLDNLTGEFKKAMVNDMIAINPSNEYVVPKEELE